MARRHWWLSATVTVALVSLLGAEECPPEDPVAEMCNGVDDDGDGFVDEGYDLDHDGYVVAELCPGVPLTDCDDQDPGVNPGAAERCDGVDNDCDGRVDNDLRGLYFHDQDGDGYGVEGEVSCQAEEGFVALRGDCDDTNPDVHPGASDAPRDGIDQDCGGTQGPDPHLGFEGSTISSLRDAVAAAGPNSTVWVAPGQYAASGTRFLASGVRVAAVRPDGTTTVAGAGDGPVFTLDGSQASSAVLDGLTIVGGASERGGGVLVDGASMVIIHCMVGGNTATDAGGGIHVAQGDLVLQYSSVEQNSAHLAGGVSLDGATVTIQGSRFAGNSSATSGGAAYVSGGDVTVVGSAFVGNSAGYRGGGLFATGAGIRVGGTRFHENRCTDLDGEGGGAFFYDVEGSLVNISLRGNRASVGGGASFYWADVPVRYSEVLANVGSEGGGLAFSFSNPWVEHCLISENQADSGGGIYAYMSRLRVQHCTIVGNAAGWGGGVLLGQQVESSSFYNSVLAFNVGHNLQNLSDVEQDVSWCDLFSDDGPNHNVWLSTGSFEMDPGFVRFVANGDPDDDDLHVLPGSPLRDAGQPGERDSDGSPADIGYYGGDIDLSYYEDSDADTLFDGWEERHGLNTSIDDARSDPDRDGLSNGMEFWASTFPQVADGDGDGWRDGDELAADTDPNDWFSRPDLEGMAVARVPEDFSSVQDAIQAMRRQGTVEVAAGSWTGDIRVSGRNLTLRPVSTASAPVVLEASSGRAFTAVWSVIDVRNVTLTGGRHSMGGGMYLAFVEGGLSHVQVERNSAIAGGGLYLDYSDVTLSQCRIAENSANGSSWYDDGGGIYAWYSNPVLYHTVIENNTATGDGGGVYLESSYPMLTCCVVEGNTAREGGGVFASNSGPIFTQTALLANAATTFGGGLLISTGSAPYAMNSIFAYNTGENVYLPSNADGVLYEFDACSLYNPSGLTNHNLTGVDDTNLVDEPGFLAYDAVGLPVDLHLATSSPLVDAGDPLVHDPDGSRADIGIFGGPLGDEWDRDLDGVPDYFWPGTLEDAPEGVDASEYDADDTDASVQ